MIRTWIRLVRIEALSLMRTSEIYTLGLLPAVLIVPLATAMTVALLSFRASEVVAVPLVDPPGVDAATAIDEAFAIVRSDDPAALLASGGAALAVTRWEAPDAGPVLAAEISGPEGPARTRLRTRLRTAANQAIDARITDAGGDPVRDRRVGSVVRPPRADPLAALDPRYVVAALCVFLAAYLGCFLVPARTVTERLSGTLEALASTAAPPGLLFAARMVVSAVFSGVVALTPFGVVFLLVGEPLPVSAGQLALDVAEALAVLTVFQAAYIVVGLVAGSVRMALYAGSYAILLAMPLFAAPAFVELPWCPLVGMAHGPGVPLQLGRIAAALAVALVGAVLANGLARWDRMVPAPGEGE